MPHIAPRSGRLRGLWGNDSERTLWVMQRRVASVCAGGSVCSAPAAIGNDLEQTSGSICMMPAHIIIVPALSLTPEPAEQSKKSTHILHSMPPAAETFLKKGFRIQKLLISGCYHSHFIILKLIKK